MKRINKLKVKIAGKEFNLNTVDVHCYTPKSAILSITFKSGNTTNLAPVTERELHEFEAALNEPDTLEATPDNG